MEGGLEASFQRRYSNIYIYMYFFFVDSGEFSIKCSKANDGGKSPLLRTGANYEYDVYVRAGRNAVTLRICNYCWTAAL